ncbi:MAG: hypothetical protein Q8L97_06550 [Nitrosomonas sp.]|uniref:hypothetical protein n=1 Tax=Nitrosomonas sp. TaxID=42353 RepID=UPI00272FEA77|nr:hypothetical protein [Nitrosomonas sp.]MDP1549804.1 hypothetical protein [Nitrosomonas sp.]
MARKPCVREINNKARIRYAIFAKQWRRDGVRFDWFFSKQASGLEKELTGC